jgi:thiol:disulfide interchange protein DsbD
MKRFWELVGLEYAETHNPKTQKGFSMKHGFFLFLILLSLLSTTGYTLAAPKEKAPNFSLQTYDGKVIELAKLKGKVVVVNFWATWCPPCRAEIPDFIKVYNTYKPQGLEIIGIALDQDGWQQVKPFTDKMQITYPIILGTMEVVQQYGGINAIPTTYIIDKDGNIAGMQVGMLTKEVLEKKVKSLLAVPVPKKVRIAQQKPNVRQVNAEAKLSADKIQAGGTAQVAIQLNIDKNWHVNSHKPSFDYLIATSFELQPKEGIIVSEMQYPKGKLVSLSIADQPIDVYEGTITIFASLKISDKLKLGTDTLEGTVTVQPCNNQICLPPLTIDINIPVKIVAAGEPITFQNKDLFANYKPTEFIPAEVKNDIVSMFEAKGSLIAFLAIFLVGLALNLTPCVYPMLAVTVSLFGAQAEKKFLRAFIKAVVYLLGIATMYSALGVMAALGGELFGSWLQSPWMLGGIAVLLFALALSSFGVYQIQMPYWLTRKLGGTSNSRIVAIYLSGLVVGVFAAPCVGPPVVALLTFVAAQGSVTFGFWIFFTLALGLGFPYLILGTFSGLLKKIPRSGSWLVWVEHIFGVILTGAALFYLALSVAPKLAVYSIPLVFILGGIFLGFIDKSGKDKSVLKRFQWIFGTIAVIIGIAFANNLRTKGMTWNTYSEKDLIEAKTNGKIVMLDFYADWCIPCLELDRNTWTDIEVIQATRDIKKMKVDLTHFDSQESEALRKKFDISGVPTVVFIRVDGTEASEARIIGFITPQEFMAKLKQVAGGL